MHVPIKDFFFQEVGGGGGVGQAQLLEKSSDVFRSFLQFTEGIF